MERIFCFKVDDWEKEYIKKASEITETEYEDTNYIEANHLVSLLEDLVSEYEKLQEECDSWQERYTDKYFGME